MYQLAANSLSSIILQYWRWHVAAGLLGIAVGFGASFLIERGYRADVVVVPSEDRDIGAALSDSIPGFSSIAAIAGLNVGGGGVRESDLEYLKSRELLRKFVAGGNVKEVLFRDRLTKGSNEWKGREPSLGAAVRRLQNGTVSILPDRRTGAVRVSVLLHDPQLAANWANQLVAQANEDLRRSAEMEARKSIEFLRAELEKTPILGVQQAINRLIETQISSIMVTNVSEDFAFKVVDPAYPPDVDQPVRPSRSLISVLGALVFMSLSIAWTMGICRRRNLHRSVATG